MLGYEGGLGCFARTDGPIEKHLAFAFGHLLSVAETIGIGVLGGMKGGF